MGNINNSAKDKATEIYTHFQAIIPHQNNRLDIVLQCSMVVAKECLAEWTYPSKVEQFAILCTTNCRFWEDVIEELKKY